MDTFLTQRDTVERCFQIERTVNNATSELTGLCLGNDVEIVGGIGKCLGTDLLGTVNQRDAWLLNTQTVTDIVHILNLLTTLGWGGDGDDSRISEEE